MTVDRRDQLDAQLIADVAAALRRWQQRAGRPPATKLLREAVWFFWQNPRLDRPLVAGKYPRSARWSRKAADTVLSTDDGATGRLVIEHITPMHRLLRQIIDAPHDAAEVAARLRSGLEIVVVTKEQSAALPDDGTPRERYQAAGLDLDAFRSLDEWEQLDHRQGGRPNELADVQPGDALLDMVGREWAVVDLLPEGLQLEDKAGDQHRFTWHALLTLGVRREESFTAPDELA